MLSISMVFGMMMLPGVALLATSLVLGMLESTGSSMTQKVLNSITSCWKVEA